MVLNKGYNIHRGIDRSKDSDKALEEDSLEKKTYVTHKLFVIKGKPDFGDTNLREYGWKIPNPLTAQQRKFLESTPGYLDYKETIFYSGPQGNAVLHTNYKKDSHKLKINLNSYQDENSDTMEIVKSMFEREWVCILDDPENKDKMVKDPIKSLVDKLKSN
jgi:hypothetical protein